MTVQQQDPSKTSDKTRGSGNQATGGSIAGRFTIAIASLVLLCMCVFWLISNYNNLNMLRQQADSLGETIARQTAVQVTELVLANDMISTRVVLEQLTRNRAIAEASVLNVNDDVIAVASNEVIPPRSIFPVPTSFGEYFSAIELENASVGSVRIVLDQTFIEAGTGNNLIFILVAAFAIMLVAILLSVSYFQYLVSFPLRLINYALQDIRYGEIRTCPDPESNNEIGRLTRQYNATAEFLANFSFLSSDNLLPEDALTKAQQSGETISSAVLCIRLANFQYLASTCDKKSMLTLMNRLYFMSENIGRLYNGRVIFCADGEVIIDFHNSQLEEEQCFYAICAGQLFLQLLGAMMRISETKLLDAKFRLGVHYGEFESGLYSPITGKFSNVHGETLDSARQICSECPDNSLLASQTAYQMAGEETRVIGEEYGEVDEPVHQVTILCSNAMSSYRQLLDQQAMRLTPLLSGGTQGEPDATS